MEDTGVLSAHHTLQRSVAQNKSPCLGKTLQILRIEVCQFLLILEHLYTLILHQSRDPDEENGNIDTYKQPGETQECATCPGEEVSNDRNSRCKLELTGEVVPSVDSEPDGKPAFDSSVTVPADKHIPPTREVESNSYRNGYVHEKRDTGKLVTFLSDFNLKLEDINRFYTTIINSLGFSSHCFSTDEANRSHRNPEYRRYNSQAETSKSSKKNDVKPSFMQIPSGQEIKKIFLVLYDLLVQETPESRENAEELLLGDQILLLEYCEQSSQTSDEKHMVSKETQKHDDEAMSEKDRLEKVVRSLKHDLKESRKLFKIQESQYRKDLFELSKKTKDLDEMVNNLQEALKTSEEELRETLHELGRLSVENSWMMKETKTDLQFQKTFKLKQSSKQTVQAASVEAATSSTSEPLLGAGAMIKPDEQLQKDMENTARNTPDESAEISTQVFMEESGDREGISLGNIPTTAVERSLYNNYKLLLLTIADRLLTDDVVKLKEWASSTFSVDVSREIINVFWELDGKGHISASNLKPLREFFEKIARIDLIHLIDCFLQGDYALLRNTNSTGIQRNNVRVTSGLAAPTLRLCGSSSSRLLNTSAVGGQNPQSILPKSGLVEVEESLVVSRPPFQNATTKTRSPVFPGRVESQGAGRQKMPEIVVTDGAAHDDGARDGVVGSKNPTYQTENKTISSTTNHVRKSRLDMGSNGNKLSKFEGQDSQRNLSSNPQDFGDSDDSDDNEQWLCNHYKRRCHVKFDCCNRYWPCHRCHNNESSCGRKKLKSRDTKFIKCVKCGKEQEFNERSQFCVNCNAKFAKYFCSICKHLTGTDDKPYHCQKCGICRIHGDRSFHCDVCGVCLDVQLRGNHKCRAGSAHDECCICLEDAFTGCQILPCSHKVHKECATQMIRNGITRCPICRESFAHKLERRPIQPPKKHKGKKREPWP